MLKHADKQIILYIGFVFCGWLQKYDKTSVFYNQIKNANIKECRKRANLPLFLACAAVLACLWVIVNPKEEKRLKKAAEEAAAKKAEQDKKNAEEAAAKKAAEKK